VDLAKKNLSILHIDTGLDWRGGQRQVLTLHSLLLENGIISTLVCNKNGRLYALAKERKVPGIIGLNYKSQFSYKCHKAIHKIYEEMNYEIIHCHDSHSVSLVRFLRKPVKFHTRRVSYPINYFSIFLKYSAIDVHIGVSNEIRNYLAKFFKNSFAVHSCIDKSRFKKREYDSMFDPKQTNILFVGAFTPQKGIEILIPAFQELTHSYSDIHLHMVGEGKLIDWAKKEVKIAELTKYVTFYGQRNEVEKFYLSSDIVICPSVSGEGSSGVIKEALAAGKIIVASNLNCNMEIIQDGVNGLLFETNNLQSLVDTLKRIIDNKIIINSNQIKKTTREFSCEKMASAYIEIYNKYRKD